MKKNDSLTLTMDLAEVTKFKTDKNGNVVCG